MKRTIKEFKFECEGKSVFIKDNILRTKDFTIGTKTLVPFVTRRIPQKSAENGPKLQFIGCIRESVSITSTTKNYEKMVIDFFIKEYNKEWDEE